MSSSVPGSEEITKKSGKSASKHNKKSMENAPDTENTKLSRKECDQLAITHGIQRGSYSGQKDTLEGPPQRKKT